MLRAFGALSARHIQIRTPRALPGSLNLIAASDNR
jgi:hypothetical protein